MKAKTSGWLQLMQNLTATRNLFRRKQAPMPEWNDPAMARDHQDYQRDSDALARFEAEWESLERRFDLKADLRKEQLRGLMPPLYRRVEARRARIAWREERQNVVSVLMQSEAQERASLVTEQVRLTRSLDRPDIDATRHVHQRVRNLNVLRAMLHDVTADARYAKPFDLFADLRSAWEAQHAARMRVFTHVIAPGYRSAPVLAPWAEALVRLRELESPAPTKEVAHVG